MVLKSIAFQPNGQPRWWLRLLLLKDQTTGQVRKPFSRIIFKKSGRARLAFSDWYEQYLLTPDKAKFSQYYSFLRGQIAGGALAQAKSLHIVTTQHTEVIGLALAECLTETRLKVTCATEMPTSFDHDLYIVVAPQMFSTLPPPERRLFIQMEQLRASQWMTPKYLELLSSSLAILDYAPDNISVLTAMGLPVRQLYFLPILPYQSTATPKNDRDIDVLFYGAVTSKRRKDILENLSSRFKVRIESQLFGSDLHRVLDRAKVVVNIHFYENALLETTRIFEALRHGAVVVSETSVDQANHHTLNGIVNFVPCGESEALVDCIASVLSDWRGGPDLPPRKTLSGTQYHILRVLNGIGVLSFEELVAATLDQTLPSDRMILALPEQTERYEFALRQRLPHAEMFHGLRHIDGWKGCALSYKFMAILALRSSRQRLLIHEDDAEFPLDIMDRLNTVERYLDQTPLVWDVFSGLITDLKQSPDVHAVHRFENEEFMHTGSFMGLVFCIYQRSILERMSQYEFLGSSIQKHTIDRYLEDAGPRCITTLVPLVGHAEGFQSSIWNNKNSHVAKMIADSSLRLRQVRDEYFDRRM